MKVKKDLSRADLIHVQRDLTALADDARSILARHPLLEVWQHLRRSDAAESFCSFVAYHLRFLVVL